MSARDYADGISIPVDYTSYVAPLSSAKLWNEVKNMKTLKDFETSYAASVAKHAQPHSAICPALGLGFRPRPSRLAPHPYGGRYVVKVHNAFEMAESKSCFYFRHPAPTLEPDNSRCGRVAAEC